MKHQSNKASAVQQTNPTHIAKPVWIDGRLRIIVFGVGTWWAIETMVCVAHWCEENEAMWN